MKLTLIFTLILTLFLFSLLSNPFIGIATYVWLEYFYPQYFMWGSLKTIPYSLILFSIIFISLIRDKNLNPLNNKFCILLFIFFSHISLSTYYAIYPLVALVEYERTAKVLLSALLIYYSATSIFRVEFLIKMLLGAVGFFIIKGAIITLLTGGGGLTVIGADKSFIADRGTFSIAIVMLLPFIFYFYTTTKNKLVKYTLIGFMIFSIITILGTYSRAGLITITFVFMCYLFTKIRLKNFLFILIIIPIAINFIPGKWIERMETISTYEEDKSAMGRINAWKYGLELAQEKPLLGGGPQAFRGNLIFFPNGKIKFVEAHSYVFELLGELGILGCLIFLYLIKSSYKILGEIKKSSDNNYRLLAIALRYSLTAYLVGGLFVSIAFHGLVYYLMALSFALRECEIKQTSKDIIDNKFTK